MRGLSWVLPVALLALAGCGQSDNRDSIAGKDIAGKGRAVLTEAYKPAPPGAQRMMAAPMLSSAAETPAEGYIAYSYFFTLELPADKVMDLQQRHVTDCAAAGRAACQAIDMSSNRTGDDQMFANLHLRLSPGQLQKFLAGLEKQAADLGGRVTNSSTNSEDLTRPVTDTMAQLKTKSELRDKFLEMLKKPDVKFSDVVQVEREVSRLQQEIDSATSMMNYYRARVDFSEVTISYQSAPRAITDDMLRPLKDACIGFAARIVHSTAGIVSWLAELLPWLALLAVAIGLMRWYWRRSAR